MPRRQKCLNPGFQRIQEPPACKPCRPPRSYGRVLGTVTARPSAKAAASGSGGPVRTSFSPQTTSTGRAEWLSLFARKHVAASAHAGGERKPVLAGLIREQAKIARGLIRDRGYVVSQQRIRNHRTALRVCDSRLRRVQIEITRAHACDHDLRNSSGCLISSDIEI